MLYKVFGEHLKVMLYASDLYVMLYMSGVCLAKYIRGIYVAQEKKFSPALAEAAISVRPTVSSGFSFADNWLCCFGFRNIQYNNYQVGVGFGFRNQSLKAKKPG